MSPRKAGATLASRVRAVARALERAGYHHVPDWWLDTLGQWLRSGRRQLVLRVGRRGGKSSTLCMLAVAVLLYGNFAVPLGDVGCVAIVSVSRDEALGRLRTIEAMLRALGVPFRSGRWSDSIELAGRPLAVRVFTASIAGVSGFTGVFALCDEVAKWRDRDTGANPAREVLATLRPALATVPDARIVLASSPMSTVDAHHEAFARGETEQQLVSHAPTWVANPSLTEAQTRELEPDPRLWAREYAAEPLDAAALIFQPEQIQDALRRGADPHLSPIGGRAVLGVDPAWTVGASADESGIVMVTIDDAGFRHVTHVEGIRRHPDALAARVVELANANRATAYVESNGAGGVIAEIIGKKAPCRPLATTATSKQARVEALSAELASGRWAFRHGCDGPAPELRKLCDELITFSLEAHAGDRASALLIACEGVRTLEARPRARLVHLDLFTR